MTELTIPIDSRGELLVNKAGQHLAHCDEVVVRHEGERLISCSADLNTRLPKSYNRYLTLGNFLSMQYGISV